MTHAALGRKLFLTCWIIYALHWAPWLVREHYPAITLAESGTLNVERFEAWSTDIFRSAQGGAYINNNPGTSVAGALPVFLARPLLREALTRSKAIAPPRRSDAEVPLVRAAASRSLLYFMLVVFLTAAGLMAPVSALAAALLGRRLAEGGIDTSRAAIAALVYAFGTPVFFRTSYLNHNLLVCQLGLIAFLLVWRKPHTPGRLFAAGLLAGYAVLCDMTGILLAGTLGLYLALENWRKAMPFVAGLAPGAVALVAYQAVAFGNPLLPAQHHMTATAITSHGYRGFAWPSPALAWANFFDPRFGLFVFNPLLIAAFAAPFVRGVRYRVPRRETTWIYAYFAIFVVFCAANHYSWLQWNTGMRYLVPVVPGLLLLSLQTIQALPRRLGVVLIGLSVAENWILAMTYVDSPLSIGRAIREGLELSWLREVRANGFMTSPAWSTPVWLSAAGLLIWLIWRTRRKTAPDGGRAVAHCGGGSC